MATKRKRAPRKKVDDSNEVTTVTETLTSQTPKERKIMAGLVEINPDEVDAILASSKTRGNYDRVMGEFLESGLQGANVPLEGPFADRQPNSLKTGFESARNRVIDNKNKEYDDATIGLARKVEVVIHNEGIYLINRGVEQD